MLLCRKTSSLSYLSRKDYCKDQVLQFIGIAQIVSTCCKC
jgi:hypothetical protein